MEIIGKIWFLGGWFYLSLILAIIVFFFVKNRLRQYLSSAVIIICAVTALTLSFQEILKNSSQLKLFFTPIDEKQDAVTFNQYSFAQGLRRVLPEGANGCIYWSHDLPTLYLQKELYPHRFNILGKGAANRNCIYIISQFKKIDDPKFSLLYQYKDNYLYKMNLIQ